MAGTAHRGLGPARARRTSMRLAWLVLGLGMALTGCTRNDAGNVVAGNIGSSKVSLQRALDAMLRPASAQAAEAFLSALPAPLAVHDTTVANMHDPRWHDTIRTLLFEGLEVTVYRVRSTGSRFPMALRVTGPGYTTAAGLRVGLTRQQVVAILGPPSEDRGAILIYRVMGPDTAPYELTVALRGGRVSALRWAAYLD